MAPVPALRTRTARLACAAIIGLTPATALGAGAAVAAPDDRPSAHTAALPVATSDVACTAGDHVGYVDRGTVSWGISSTLRAATLAADSAGRTGTFEWAGAQYLGAHAGAGVFGLAVDSWKSAVVPDETTFRTSGELEFTPSTGTVGGGVDTMTLTELTVVVPNNGDDIEISADVVRELPSRGRVATQVDDDVVLATAPGINPLSPGRTPSSISVTTTPELTDSGAEVLGAGLRAGDGLDELAVNAAITSTCADMPARDRSDLVSVGEVDLDWGADVPAFAERAREEAETTTPVRLGGLGTAATLRAYADQATTDDAGDADAADAAAGGSGGDEEPGDEAGTGGDEGPGAGDDGGTVTPPVQTCTPTPTISSAQIKWGFKQSFRSYIRGPIAAGGWTTASGATFEGGRDAANGAFVFPVDGADSRLNSGGTTVLGGTGQVRFTGHHGLLDSTISKPTVELTRNGGTLKFDYRAKKVEEFVPGSPFTWLEGKAVPLANLSFSGANLDRVGTHTINATASMHSRGVPVFNDLYETGRAMDPVTLVVTVTDGCGGLPGNANETGTGSLGKLTTGLAGVSALLSEVSSIANSVISLSETFTDLVVTARDLDTLLTGRVHESPNQVTITTGGTSRPAGTTAGTGGTTAGTGGTSRPAGTTAGAGGAGGATTGGTSRPAGTTSGAGGTATTGGGTTAGTAQGPAAPAGGAGVGAVGATSTGDICTDSTSKGVTAGAVSWGVRDSFRTYVRGAIAKGDWQLDGTDYTGGAFTWHASGGAVDTAAGEGTVAHDGAVRFAGHSGVLDTTIAAPEVEFWGPNQGMLIASVRSADTDGNITDYGRVELANLAFDDLTVTDSSVSGTASNVTITSAGSTAFAGFYEPGERLDPLVFSASLSGGANCVGAQGTAAASGGGAGGGAAGGSAGGTTGGAAGTAAALRAGGSAGGTRGAAGAVNARNASAEGDPRAASARGSIYQARPTSGDDGRPWWQYALGGTAGVGALAGLGYLGYRKWYLA